MPRRESSWFFFPASLSKILCSLRSWNVLSGANLTPWNLSGACMPSSSVLGSFPKNLYFEPSFENSIDTMGGEGELEGCLCL